MPSPTFIPGWENGLGTLFSGMKRFLRRWIGPAIVLFVLWRWAPRGEAPPLGILNGRLSPCPDSPNAVSSQASGEAHAIEPLTTRGRMTSAWIHCRNAAIAESGSLLVRESPGYMRFEVTTRWFRFVDDLEFLADPGTDRIQVRSSSRIGYSDLGANRRRVERIRARYGELMDTSTPESMPKPTDPSSGSASSGPTSQPRK